MPLIKYYKKRRGLKPKKSFKNINHKFPLITIVTVVHNDVRFIEKTIQSVLNQTYQSNPIYSIYTNPRQGACFGSGFDLNVADQSNSNNKSIANIGYSYQAPSMNAASFLAGSLYFQILEVEVYTIISIYSISFI